MFMKEEYDKLRYAADLLVTGTPGERKAAMEHVEYVLRTTDSVSLRTEAERIKKLRTP